MRRGNETTNCTPDELSRSCYSIGSPARSISSSCEQNSNPETNAPTTKVQKSEVQWPLITLSQWETPGNWHFRICDKVKIHGNSKWEHYCIVMYLG